MKIKILSKMLPPILDNDINQPQLWMESLNEDQLLYWLAKAILERDTLPIIVPSVTDFVSQLSHIVRTGKPQLRLKFWQVLPILLRSWGRGDPAFWLDNLLILAGRLRCVTAEVAILIIIRERLEKHPEEIKLCQRCLSTLAGLGPSSLSISLFQDYIRKLPYAPICYRALYRYNPVNAVKEFPTLLSSFKDIEALKPILNVLMRDYFKNQMEKQLDFIVKIFSSKAIKNESKLFQKFYNLLYISGFIFILDYKNEKIVLMDEYIEQEIGCIIPEGDIYFKIENIYMESNPSSLIEDFLDKMMKPRESSANLNS